MNIKQILSNRKNKYQNYALPIIYEWEDIIAKELNTSIISLSIIQKIAIRLNLPSFLIKPFKTTFRFITNGKDYDKMMNGSTIIPCIIDFFETEDKLEDFYKKHSKNKLLLLSSPFDYQYLKQRNCPIPIGLFAYSLSDKYNIYKMDLEKKYDIVLTGRQDPLLYSFFKKYIETHPNVSYVKRGNEIDNDINKTKEYYLNGRKSLGTIETRDDFMNLQAQGRVTLYGTQGYEEFGKGFYHMTPHFLEIIACGCHVIAHYPTGKDGIDADFYEVYKFSPSIENYEDFENAMDKALSTNVDIQKYSEYLNKHYTSARARELKQMINKI